MKILLDENLDADMKSFLSEHDVVHVRDLGWGAIKNGELMARAESAGFDLMLTADKNMPYQQRMAGRAFALVIFNIHPNLLEGQLACVPELLARLDDLTPGTVVVIQGPGGRPKPPKGA